MAIIRITNLKLRTIIGINDWEREAQQDIIINIKIEFDETTSSETDDINDTIDYSKIEYLIKEIGELHHYKLLESLGEEITNKIKKEFDVKKILIKINKKNILPNTDFVGVILER